MKIQLVRVKHRQTGIVYWFSKKRAWGKSYYSADGQETWHPTRAGAAKAAAIAGKLEPVNQNEN